MSTNDILDDPIQLVESGTSMHRISRCFPSCVDAYEFYARTLQSRFSPQEAANAATCACCGHHHEHVAHQIT